MSVHQFPTRRLTDLDAPCVDEELDDLGVDDDIDDGDETLNRYGTVDRPNRLAHRVINTSVLAALTGYPTVVCEEFHHVLFSLLESVGDFDGLITTPTVCVGRADALAVARAWVGEHPPVDIDARIADADETESNDETWRRIIADIEAHSLALAVVAGTNPSLTFGSLNAVSERITDGVLEIALSCMPEQITTLTRVAFDLIARLPDPVVIVGRPGRASTLARDPFEGWQP